MSGSFIKMAAPMCQCLRSLANLTRFSRNALFRSTQRRSDLCRFSTTNVDTENEVKTNANPESKEDKNGEDDTKQTELLELKEKLTKENEKLGADFKEIKDKYMRALAETENVRTRMKKQVDEAKLFGIQGFCKDLLEVADILNQAMDSVPKEEMDQNQHLKALFNGLTMTNQQMLKVFGKHGLVKIEPQVGDKFDPFFHEALFQVPAQDKSQGNTIADIQKTGYKLHERTIKPAWPYRCINKQIHFALRCRNEGDLTKIDHIATEPANEYDEAFLCYNCGESGHNQMNCPDINRESRHCYRCGQKGHLAINCPDDIQELGPEHRKCYKCGEVGHLSRDCKVGSMENEKICYKCGQKGHLAMNCPEDIQDNRKCFNCGEFGHLSRDCTVDRSGSSFEDERRCYKCGQKGHLSKNCPDGSAEVRECYNCGEVGHLSKDCKVDSSDRGYHRKQNKPKCYKCGELGHIARDCIKLEENRKCYICGKFGHLSTSCPEQAMATTW